MFFQLLILTALASLTATANADKILVDGFPCSTHLLMGVHAERSSKYLMDALLEFRALNANHPKDFKDMELVKTWERKVIAVFKRIMKFRGTEFTSSRSEGIHITPLAKGGGYLNRIVYWIQKTTGARVRYNPRLVIFAGGMHSEMDHQISLNWECILNDGRDHKLMHEWVHAYVQGIYEQKRRCVPCGRIRPVNWDEKILFGTGRALMLERDFGANQTEYADTFSLDESFAYAETFFFLGKILNDIMEGEPDRQLRQVIFQQASGSYEVAIHLAMAISETSRKALENLKALRSTNPDELGVLGPSKEFMTREVYEFSPETILQFDWFDKNRSGIELEIHVKYNYRTLRFILQTKEEDIVRATRMLHRKSASKRERREARDTILDWAESQLQANHEANKSLVTAFSTIGLMMPSRFMDLRLPVSDEDRRDALYEPREIIRQYMPR